MSVRSSRNNVEDARERGAGCERTLRRALNDRAVSQRIRKRDADLEHVGARAIERAQDAPRALQISDPCRDVCHQSGCALVAQACERRLDRVSFIAGIERTRPPLSMTVCTSLSRPERFDEHESSPTAASASAASCRQWRGDDSSAGRMPSRRASVLKPVERFGVEMCAYSVRPSSRSHACSSHRRVSNPAEINASARYSRGVLEDERPRPWSTPVPPAANRARGAPARSSRRPASTPINRTPASSMNRRKMPMALLPHRRKRRPRPAGAPPARGSARALRVR